MDSKGDPTTTARLSPVASTSSYFLQLDPSSGRIEIVDSSMAPNRTLVDLGAGDETVYEIRDEDYFLSGQFMDHGLPEMDPPMVDISDLLDKPLQGFLQDESPQQGNNNNSFATSYAALTSMSGYEEIRGSERDTVQQAIDDAYGSGSLSDPIVLEGGGGDDNNMIFCVNNTTTTANQDSNAQITQVQQTQSSSSEISSVNQSSMSGVPIPLIDIDIDGDESEPRFNNAITTLEPNNANEIMNEVHMQQQSSSINIQMNPVDVVVEEESEVSKQNKFVAEPVLQQQGHPGQEILAQPQDEIAVVNAEMNKEDAAIVEPSNVPESPSVPLTVQLDSDSFEEMDLDIKIVSCYSQSEDQQSQSSTPECEAPAENVNDNNEPPQLMEVELNPEFLVKREPVEEELLEVNIKEEKPDKEEPAVVVKEEVVLEEKVEKKDETEVVTSRKPILPEWLFGNVDRDDELLLAYNSRPDPMMTAICVFCYTWFYEKEELQEHIVTEHAKKSKFHKCRKCGAKFTARILRVRHEKLHRYDLKHPWFMYTSKSGQYDSVIKNHFTKRFRPAPLSDSYSSHLKKVFSLVEPFPCMNCEEEFPDEESQKEHYLHSHASQSCRFCGKVLGNWRATVQHEKEYHGHYEIEKNVIGGGWDLFENWSCDEALEKEQILLNTAFLHNYAKRPEDVPAPYQEEFIEREIVMLPWEENPFLNPNDSGSWVNIQDGTALQFKQEVQDLLDMQPCDDPDQTLPFRCDYCPQSYDNAHDLRRHSKCHATENRPLQCQYCGKGFKTHSHKKEHERTHTNDRPYKCPICSRSFIQSSNLKKHIQTHKSLNTLQCDTCGKQFIKESSLVLHQRAHAQDRKFRCQICDRAYNYASLLKRHMRIHTGETPYSCEVCGQLFHELVSLHYHRKKVHTGERPHICDQCGRAFILSSDLKKHIQIHLKPPLEKPQKKPTQRRSRSQSKSVEGEANNSNEVIEILETNHQQQQPEQKLNSIAEADEENGTKDVEMIEEIQLESGSESSANEDDVTETTAKVPALRVYQRKESKPMMIPATEEIKHVIPKEIQQPQVLGNPLPVLENIVESEEKSTTNLVVPQPEESLSTNADAMDVCDRDMLLSNVFDEMLEESLVTVVLDETGQELVNEIEVENSDLIS